MFEIVDNNNNYDSYIIKYSNDELVNEVWKCLKDILFYFKKYMSYKDQNLYNIDYIFISNFGRVIELKK